MLQKKTIFDFFANVFMIYGITVAILMGLCLLVGEEAQEVSTIFRLGNEGLSLATLLQFFFMVIFLVVFEWLFFTDLVIKNWSMFARTASMFGAVILTVGIFAAVFQWFPVDMVEAWVSFLLCFFLCAAVSTGVSALKEKSENKKMQEALERLKEGKEDGE